MKHKPWYMPLSLIRQVFLLFHVTLGYRLIYPSLILMILKQFNALWVIDLGYANAFLSIFMLITSFFLAHELFYHSFIALKKHPLEHLKTVLFLLPLMIFSSILINGIVSNVTGLVNSTNQSQVIETFFYNPWLMTFQALIYAPIMEELMFRGLYFGMIRKFNGWFALFLSGLLFGLAHVSSSLFLFHWQELWFLPSYMVLGIILAFAYERSHTVYTSMALHFLNNLISLYAIYLVGSLS